MIYFYYLYFNSTNYIMPYWLIKKIVEFLILLKISIVCSHYSVLSTNTFSNPSILISFVKSHEIQILELINTVNQYCESIRIVIVQQLLKSSNFHTN